MVQKGAPRRPLANEFAGDFGGFDVSDGTVDRSCKADTGHARLTTLMVGGWTPRWRSPQQLR